jgi:hypothetical protein
MQKTSRCTKHHSSKQRDLHSQDHNLKTFLKTFPLILTSYSLESTCSEHPQKCPPNSVEASLSPVKVLDQARKSPALGSGPLPGTLPHKQSHLCSHGVERSWESTPATLGTSAHTSAIPSLTGFRLTTSQSDTMLLTPTPKFSPPLVT